MYIKCYQKESLFHAKPEEIREVVLGEKIEKLTCRYGMPCEVHSRVETDGVTVCVEVSGDWKHTHKYLDFLVEEMFSPDSIEETPVSMTDTDYYTSEHRYYFPLA